MHAEACIPKLSAEEKLCVIRGAFDGRSSIDVNKATNELRYIVLDCGNDRAMDILAKLLHEIGIRYNCNYARERLEGGEPRKPQLRVAAASGMLFARKVEYISAARMRILQSVLGSSYEQRESNDILNGLKLLVHNESSIGKQVAQNVPPKCAPVQNPHGVTSPVSHTSKETQSVASVNIPPVKIGETVIHRSFGIGTIITIQAVSLFRKPAEKVNYAQTISKYLFALLLFGSNGLVVSFIDLAVCKLFC